MATLDLRKSRRFLRALVTAVLVAILALGVRGALTLLRASVDALPSGGLELAALAAALAVFLAGLLGGVVQLARLAGSRGSRQPIAPEVATLAQAALTDSLTGLRNHRAFHEDLRREISRRNRTGAPFSLLMIDLNGLKQVNDTFGHQAGDERIKAVADAIRATVRGHDCGYRVGGDEFMVILPAERAWGALNVANRLHSEVAARGTASVTVGIAESTVTESKDTLVKRSDLALYEAKRCHLGTVVFSPELEPQRDEPAPEETRHVQELIAAALARAVDAKDAGTRNHCETVGALSAMIGERLGLPAERLRKLRLAGLLHDVGKIGISDSILQKPGPLSDREWEIMRTHAGVGHNIVSATELEEEARWVLHHHERFDGSGYPEGAVAGEIPLESRIIFVADAFEAMTSDRPYRAGRSPEEALDELVANAGTQFDPACVAALCSIFDYVPARPLSPRPDEVDEVAARRSARAGREELAHAASDPMLKFPRTSADR
ncbi:MAG TPA: diguanylate cyclase [Gaiellaceae bacterium]|nr:diguanylate cyclase [Gaiellaceae bacterium]